MRVVSGRGLVPCSTKRSNPVLAHVFEEVFLMPAGEHGGGEPAFFTHIIGAQYGGLMAAFGVAFADLAQPVAVA